jgi:O-methyltransferase involved in polyketide biosynthesis
VDAGTPTVWIAEGVFYYLDPDAMANILRDMARLSADGSRLIFSQLNAAYFKACMSALGDSSFPLDNYARSFYESWKSSLPEDVASYLADIGWSEDSIRNISDVHKVRQAF